MKVMEEIWVFKIKIKNNIWPGERFWIDDATGDDNDPPLESFENKYCL